MIVLRGADCRVDLVRGRLKHSWLENQLLDMTADEVIDLRKNLKVWQELDQQFPALVKETARLADELEEGFSPSQLVDRLASLDKLDEKTRKKLKSTVHQAYLEATNIRAYKRTLKETACALGEKIERMIELWNKPLNGEVEAALRKEWQALQRQGRALWKILEELPKGIVLP